MYIQTPKLGTAEGLNELIAEREYYKTKLKELTATRESYGKNEVENYQTGAYDMEAAVLISHIEDLTVAINNFVIIKDTDTQENTVNMNDIVDVLMVDFDEVKRVKIVGGKPSSSKENDYTAITLNSPLGNAIYKKNIGDSTSYKVGDNIFNIIILAKVNQAEKVDEKQPFAD